MTDVAIVVSSVAGWAIASTAAAVFLFLEHQRLYRYAVHCADHEWEGWDTNDLFRAGRSSAYSDMATVITLGGRAEPPWDLPRPGSPKNRSERAAR